MSTLDVALAQFGIVEANRAKLDKLWKRIETLLPNGRACSGPTEYDDACFAFRNILVDIPTIDGFRLADELNDYDVACQMNSDALEVGDIETSLSVARLLGEQGRCLAEYRRCFRAKRRELVRARLLALIERVDRSLASMQGFEQGRETNAHVDAAAWADIVAAVDEIDTLLGSDPRPARWSDLRRHLAFGMIQDLVDVRRLDWPVVRPGIQRQMYGEDEALPVDVSDLGTLVATNPIGPVAHALQWSVLSAEDFERLVFNLISNTPGYENAQWLQHTSAPDRGRDLSVVRTTVDPLSGTLRSRVIIQCKHWLTTSVRAADVAVSRAQMELWQPPRVDELIVATSGRFTVDAVALIEQHNLSDRALAITMWPESHLEALLAQRPYLVAEFRLRSSVE